MLYQSGRKALDFRPGYKAYLKWGLLLLDVLLSDAHGCPATTGGKVRWRPQDVVPIASLKIRPLDTEQPTGNAFEAVDHARHRALRRVMDEQVNVFGFAIDLDQLRLEVGAYLLEYDFELLDCVPAAQEVPGEVGEAATPHGKEEKVLEELA
jgi:hypothetical protein